VIIIINFKCLTLEDNEIINRFVDKDLIESYEYLFSSLYMWRKLNNVKYTIIDETLVIEKSEEGKGTFYSKPLHYKKENLVKLS
jgi:hypothetical protein